MARATLGFCGIRPVRSLVCGSVKDASQEQRQHWLEQARRHGRSLKRGRITPGEQLRHKAAAWLKAMRLQFYPMTWLAYAAGALAASPADGVFGNAGQVCTAGTRLLVQRGIADQLVERIAVCARKLKAGPTWRADSDFPPIISAAQAERVGAIVDRALAAGASAVVGGKRMEVFGDGAYFEPTVLVDVDAGMEAVRGEIFGPVLTVQRFDDEDEAFALANDSSYGLAAGVHTSDLGRALRALRQLQVGSVWVNRYGRSADYILPTGGYKQSGIGKDLGRQSYEGCLRYKAALIAFG